MFSIFVALSKYMNFTMQEQDVRFNVLIFTWGPNIQRISIFQYFLVMKTLLCSPNICRKIQIASLTSLTFGQKLRMFLWIKSLNEWTFSNFSCRFLNPNIFSIMNHNCSNVLDLRNLHEQVKKAFCLKYCTGLSLF